jgi:hypothetical protein
MAYADGELAPESRKAVEAVLAVDPIARERLAAFTSTRREGLAPLFDPLIGEPVPEHLRDLVLGLSPWLNGVQATPDVSLPRRAADVLVSIRSFLAPPAMRWATLALVLGLAMWTGWLLGRASIGAEIARSYVDPLSGVSVAAGPLLRALEGTPSGTPVSWPDADGVSVSFRAEFSFLSQDQRYCRQYEVIKPGGSEFAGLACRSGNDVWQIEMHARVPARVRSPEKGVVPAERGSGPVDAAVLDMMLGEPLVGTQEMALIRGRWGTTK